METIATVTREAARAGASVAMEHFQTDVDQRQKRGKGDLVTVADEAAQEAVIETIQQSRPDDAIVGEEGDELKSVPEQGPAWIIDPIDGTTNFVYGLRRWGTAVAHVRDGEPVASAFMMPALDEEYVAREGTVTMNGASITTSARRDVETFMIAPILRFSTGSRDNFEALTGTLVQEFNHLKRVGSAQSSLALLARGSFDATVGLGVANPWDTVAGVQMIREAGGTVTDVDGERWVPGSDGIVASNGNAHGKLLTRLAKSGLVTPADA